MWSQVDLRKYHYKASGGDAILSSKRWCCENAALNRPANLENSAQDWPQDWKRSVLIPIPKKGNAKECSNNHTIALISHTIKVMLKILQARLQQYMSHEIPDVQAGFRKGRGIRDQIANIRWIIEKSREFQKKSASTLLTTPKPLTLWIIIICGKFWKRWAYLTTWPASWETCMQVIDSWHHNLCTYETTPTACITS